MDFKKLNEQLLERIPTWAEGGPLLVPIDPEEKVVPDYEKRK